MGIRIEQVDIKSLNKVFPMKDEINGFIQIVEDLDSTILEIENELKLKANSADLSSVATTGSYNDLLDKPESLPANGGNADSVGGKVVDDSQSTSDNLWTAEKIIEYVNTHNSDQDDSINDKVSKEDFEVVENKVNNLEENISNKVDNSTFNSYKGEISEALKLKADKTEVQTLSVRVDEKVGINEFNVVKDQIPNLALKSDVDYLNSIFPSFATKTEVQKVSSKVDTKAEKTEITRIDEILPTKLDIVTFETFKEELVNARKGHASLLDKINEIDRRLDELTSVQANGITDLALGSIIWFAGTEAPRTYKVCDGSAISRSEYSDLFKIIQTTYGVGDGSSTFNLPNLVEDGRFIRSSGGSLRVSNKQDQGVADVRNSYEGNFNTDKLYLVGGKSYTSSGIEQNMEPSSIALLPCIKVEEDGTPSMDTPVGMFNWFAGNELPEDYLECDGRAVSRSTYSDLFAIIGTTYGEGDRSSTFNLPDLKTDGRFIRSKTSSITVGTKKNGSIKLTDVREAYEGENGEVITPVGGKSFSSPAQEAEMIPDSVAMKPAIKVKKKTTEIDRIAIGTFNWFSSPTTPVGYVLCDGSTISRAEYPELFEAIGTTYGEGDGRSTFTLPNLVGLNRFIRSYTGSIALGTYSTLKLNDIRTAYEGDNNNDKLYPLGAKYFDEQSVYSSLHPKNIAFLPCLKAKNVKAVDLASTLQLISEIQNISKLTEIANVSTVEKSIEKTVKLSKGKANIKLSKKELNMDSIKNVFVNVMNTDLGAEHICEINANATINKGTVTIYLKALENSLSSSNVSINIFVIGE